MSVCVDLIGRLGNNLFQIACAVGYAEKHGVEYWIPSWEYATCFKTNFTKQSCGSTNYGEKGWYYEDLPYIENVKLFGFFQSYKYFEHCESKIRELFQFNDGIKKRMSQKYALTGNTCSIHVRRGDYVNNHFHEVCHLEYYNDAIAEMKNRAAIDKFVVFSDDINWCRENLKGEDFLFIEGNSNVEELYLMTQCKNNIIANSSFSWWGAWLGTNPNKIVIAPGTWFGDASKGTEDLLPKEWIQIKINK